MAASVVMMCRPSVRRDRDGFTLASESDVITLTGDLRELLQLTAAHFTVLPLGGHEHRDSFAARLGGRYGEPRNLVGLLGVLDTVAVRHDYGHDRDARTLFERHLRDGRPAEPTWSRDQALQVAPRGLLHQAIGHRQLPLDCGQLRTRENAVSRPAHYDPLSLKSDRSEL